MRKGDLTRHAILDHATELASQVGLTGLTIGRLADELSLSKSGLFRHFQSKEALQVQVLEHGAERFAEEVLRPSLETPPGVGRLRAVFELWRSWDSRLAGGCVFVAASSELDDRPGAVRDRLVELQRSWVQSLAHAFRRAADVGEVRADADAEQFAQDMYGIMLAWHHHARLLGDAGAERRARRAFDALLSAARAEAPQTDRDA